MRRATTTSGTEARPSCGGGCPATPAAVTQLLPQRTAKLRRAYRFACHRLFGWLDWRHWNRGRWGGSDAEREAEEQRSGVRGQGLEDRGQGLEVCASSALCLPPSALLDPSSALGQEKGTGIRGQGRGAVEEGAAFGVQGWGAVGTKSEIRNQKSEISSRGYNLLRFVVALILLTAAALKGYDLSTAPVAGEGLLNSRWFLIVIVEMELLFGFWLAANICPKLTWAATLTCFTVFTCVSLGKAVSGYASCGCFGRVQVNPWHTATLDLAIVLSLLYWRPRLLPLPFGRGAGGERGWVTVPLAISGWRLPTRAIAVLLAWLSLGLPAAYAMTSYAPTTLSDVGDIIGNGKIVVLKPETWIGKTFPLLDHIDIGSGLAQGRWLVLLYHSDCPKCQDAISRYGQLSDELAMRGDTTQVALIEVPPYGEDSTEIVSLHGQCTVGRLNDAKQWFVQTPLELVLDRTVVTTVDM